MLKMTDIQPIGMDIGHDSVRMLQLDAKGNTLTACSAAARRLQIADGAAGNKGEQSLAAAMNVAADMLKDGGFIGRSVAVALPREIVHIKNLRLPMIPVAELPAAIAFEARNIFPFDTDTAHIEFLHAGEVRQGSDARQEVIVLAAKHADVDAFVERLDRIGLRVASLDAEPCAIYRSLERFIRRRDDEQEVNVILDMGLRRTQVLIGRGREISFFKPIDIGGHRLNDAVSKRLNITLEEARSLRWRLAESDGGNVAEAQDAVRQAVFHAVRGPLEELGREVSLCLRYHSVTFRGPGPARVRLAGGEAHDPHTAQVLRSILSIPVEAAQPLYNVDGLAMKPPDSEWATALGLALKKTTGRFAAKDGRPRATRPGLGEVIDLNQAVAGASDGKPSLGDSKPSSPEGRFSLADGKLPSIDSKPSPPEVARA